MLPETLPVLLLAVLLDALFGYPNWIFRKIGHPVTWIGSLINLADRCFNREHMPTSRRKLLGSAAILGVGGIAAAVAFIFQLAVSEWPWGWIATSVAASTLIAGRSLYTHVAGVAEALESGGVEAGREAVAHIVGRDTNTLDEHGVGRAAIESLAENASDGVAAPVFWFAVLGLPGLVAYRAINTADSMIGHRTPRHTAFGWASARLDDLVNLPASRLAALVFGAAAFFARASPLGAFRAVIRDAHKHRSPNAGWPEAAMAGALRLRLAGPRCYGGAVVEDAFMGDGRFEATAGDIKRALRLARIGWMIMVVLIATAALVTAQV
ncbi:MAG: adenosylcobinamide-phosphate synthase CbiB [Rhodomicrobium sp.]